MDPAFSYLINRTCNSCLIIVYKATWAEKKRATLLQSMKYLKLCPGQAWVY